MTTTAADRLAALEAADADLHRRVAALAGRDEEMGHRVDVLAGREAELGRRVDALAGRGEEVERRVAALEAAVLPRAERSAEADAVAARERTSRRPVGRGGEPDAVARGRRESGRPVAAAWSGVAMEDLLGGRVLAWVGGVATLLGLALLLAVAVSRGWLGEEARLVLAFATSLGLLGVGARGYERRGRTDAAAAAAATGVAGLFASIAVGAQAYELIPDPPAIALALATGATATALALKWDAKLVAALAILGGLLSPLVAGADLDGVTVAVVGLAYAAGAAVLVHRRWSALGVAAWAAVTPQWALWLALDEQSLIATYATLIGFGALTVAAAVGAELRDGDDTLRLPAALLLTLNALVLAGVGFAVLDDAAARATADLWLVALALAHLAVGLSTGRLQRVSHELGLAALALGVLLADVAATLLLDGAPLAIAWAGTTVVMAGLTRVYKHRRSDRIALSAGVELHLALSLGHALLVDAVPGTSGDLDALAVLAAVTAGCFVSGRLRPGMRMLLDGVGFCTLAYLTALAVPEAWLPAAWAGEALALARLAAGNRARISDPIAAAGAALFGLLAGSGTIALHAPPTALVDGLDDMIAGMSSLAAITGAAGAAAYALRRERRLSPALAGSAAIAALYLVSTLLISAFQPDTATFVSDGELSIRQQGQVLLSGLWALSGLAAVVAGLRGDRGVLRRAGLALLLVTVAKVFIYDLAALDSVYRVASVIGLGLLLLAGAFAWQRLRPAPTASRRSAAA